LVPVRLEDGVYVTVELLFVQLKVPVVEGVVEKALCTVLVFMPRLKFNVIVVDVGTLTASCEGEMLSTNGFKAEYWLWAT
jgi:hypothetical protein